MTSNRQLLGNEKLKIVFVAQRRSDMFMCSLLCVVVSIHSIYASREPNVINFSMTVLVATTSVKITQGYPL